MNRSSVHEKRIVSPWREAMRFNGTLFFQNKPIAGVAAVLPITRLLFNQFNLNQIVQCALDGAKQTQHLGRDLP